MVTFAQCKLIIAIFLGTLCKHVILTKSKLLVLLVSCVKAQYMQGQRNHPLGEKAGYLEKDILCCGRLRETDISREYKTSGLRGQVYAV